MFSNNFRILFFWIVNIAAAVFFNYTAGNLERMREYFLSTSYYFFVALFLFWLVTLITYCNINIEKIKKHFNDNKFGLLLSLLITVVVFVAVPSGLKVLADEANVMSVSKSMVFQKRVGNVTEGLWYYNNFNPLSEELELRPLTLPFFVHLVHVFTGYRVANVFAVNFILLFVFLSIVYVISKKYWGSLWAVALQLFIMSQPLVSQLATSGGIDFIYMVFFLICLVCLIIYIKIPNALNLLLLTTNLLLFANTRYEAIFLVIIIIVLLLLLRKIKWEFIQPHLITYSVFPLLMLPSMWQRIFKFRDNELPVDKAASLENSIANTKLYLASMFDFSLLLPLANIINILSIIFGVVLLINIFRKKIFISEPRKAFAIIFSVCIISMWLIITVFNVSTVNHPSQSRLFLSFVVTGTVIMVWGLHQFRFFKVNPFLVLIVSAMCFVFYLPNAIENRFVNKQLIIREYDFTMNFFETEPDRNFVVINERPGLYTIHNFGAVSYHRANTDDGNLLLNLSRHLYRKIYVVQEIEYATMKPVKNHELNAVYFLKPVKELQNTPESFLRISEVALVANNEK